MQGQDHQTPEARAFLERIVALPKGPGVSLDDALQPSLSDESALRKLFATDKDNIRLQNPYVGLVDVFNAPADIKVTRARVVLEDDKDDWSAKYVLPLPEERRRKEGTPCMAESLDELRKNWAIFTEGSLSQLLDWNNVVAAGGSVHACLTPLTDEQKASKRSIRKHYHGVAYPTSDVDLFLWGLTPEQAEKKIITIYEAVRDSVPWDVTCIRTKHTVSIHSQYPYRSIQVVLRLYSSPSEILTGFDVDAPCFAYDGQRVWGNPRAIVSMMRQCNTVDVTRRSPSYEVRLTKYASRDLEIYVPSLRRADIDPTIYERAINRIEGLARLLVLEKLSDTESRYNFLDSRRTLRGRNNALNRYTREKKKYRGDLKADLSVGGLEWNDYDVVSLHIPYGPGWDSRRIEKLVYQTDLGMNSPFNPKNKKRNLHHHVAFFGNMDECIEDCCEHCPEPANDEERALQEEEDKQHIRGRISFIQEDPGRQSLSGSFNPIDIGEWSSQVYIGPTAQFFAAIASHDLTTIKSTLASGDYDIHRRDHVGRTCLHLAIICGADDIACELIDSGARMTARLVDGRSSLHLAAQYDRVKVVKKLLERSAVNDELAKEVEERKRVEAEEAKKEKEGGKKGKKVKGGDGDDGDGDDDAMDEDDEGEGEEDGEGDDDERGSSEDDWDSDEDGKKKSKKGKDASDATTQPENSGDIPDDALDEPDVLNPNIPDWDFAFTPLCYAVLSGSPEVVEVLIAGGADPKFVAEVANGTPLYHPLLVASLREDKTQIIKIVERLLLGGASSSTAESSQTIFYRAVAANNVDVVSALLKSDPNASTVVDYPQSSHWQITFPINEAIGSYHYAMVALLLAYGAKPFYSEEWIVQQNLGTSGWKGAFQNVPPERAVQPLETAFASQSDVIKLLIALGAQVNVGIKEAHAGENSRRTYLDWANYAIASLNTAIETTKKSLASDPDLGKDAAVDADAATAKPDTEEKETLPPWKIWRTKELERILNIANKGASSNAYILDRQHKEIQSKQWYVEVKKHLTSVDAKSWEEVFPDQKSTARNIPPTSDKVQVQSTTTVGYVPVTAYGWSSETIPKVEVPMYDQLFEACYEGDNEKVQKLCFPESREGKTPVKPLRISVQVEHPENRYSKTGLTPLQAAIANKKWETAKLILAITMAQYKKRDEEETFRASDYMADSDSENEDDDMETDEPDLRINFVDVAKRSSTIQCDVSPKHLLQGNQFNFASSENGPLSKTIYDKDFEAFINVGALYTVLPTAIEFPENLVDAIIRQDEVEMLDQLIRWSGLGLDDKAVPEPEDKPVDPNAAKKKVYLGLNVHGKKRSDLATKKDPHTNRHGATTTAIHPLVFRAAKSGAKKIIEYLAGDRPLAAYKFYASTHSTDIAQRLKYTQNLDKVLPEWLGWTISPLGESPLTAAILSTNLEMIKLLFAKMPKLMGSTLHTRIKFVGYNTLMLAADSCYEGKTEVVEFLLGQSVSPAESDSVRSWNIYHICCQKNQAVLLEYFLKNLPRDVSEALLNQKSKKQANTPLHIAVKVGATACVKLILEFSPSNLLARNTKGSIPLHIAVSHSFAKVTELLVKYSPTEALYTENAVGEVPLAMITLANAQQKINGRNNTRNWELQTYQVTQTRELCSVATIEEEAPKLRAVVQTLLQDGKLRQGTKLAQELTAFVDYIEGRIPKIKAIEAEGKAIVEKMQTIPKRQFVNDTPDIPGTLKVIQDAVDIDANKGKRQLVHLIDVQASVQGDLPKNKRKQVDVLEALRNRRHGDVLEEQGEEEEGAEEKAKGMVFSVINVNAYDDN